MDSDRGIPLGRAAFLATVLAGAGGVALASRYSSAVSGAMADVAGAIPVVNQVAPTRGWRIYAVDPPMPVHDPVRYRLEVGGLVARPASLSLGDLAALGAERQVSDFHCVTGWSVEDVTWEGLRPQALIDLVGPSPEARYVTFSSLEEPYVDQLTLDQFLLEDVLLAVRMDGAPLSRAHGAPLRLVVPRMYGYKSVKWVSGVRFDATPSPGYWEVRGYDVDAWVGRSNGLG